MRTQDGSQIYIFKAQTFPLFFEYAQFPTRVFTNGSISLSISPSPAPHEIFCIHFYFNEYFFHILSDPRQILRLQEFKQILISKYALAFTP